MVSLYTGKDTLPSVEADLPLDQRIGDRAGAGDLDHLGEGVKEGDDLCRLAVQMILDGRRPTDMGLARTPEGAPTPGAVPSLCVRRRRISRMAGGIGGNGGNVLVLGRWQATPPAAICDLYTATPGPSASPPTPTASGERRSERHTDEEGFKGHQQVRLPTATRLCGSERLGIGQVVLRMLDILIIGRHGCVTCGATGAGNGGMPHSVWGPAPATRWHTDMSAVLR